MSFSIPLTSQNGKLWTDRGTFYEHIAPQGTDEWLEARKGRISSSNSGAMAGKSKFKSPQDMGKIIAGVEQEQFTQKNLDDMSWGTLHESAARNWYETRYVCKVLERGLCVPKSDYRLGASIDGEILGNNGIIEIKCPKKMYRPLLNYMEHLDHGWKSPAGYHSHIWDSHYFQMQHGCFVTNRKFCDYVVYCPEESKIFTQRITFDKKHWKEHYVTIIKNYDLYIKPYLNGKYPICPL